jgi:hypothetical protein
MVWSPDTFLVKPRSIPPPTGDVRVYATNVRFVPRLGLAAARRPQGVKKIGLMYERRVLDVLSAIYGEHFRASPAIEYVRRGKRRLAIPDGLLYFEDHLVVVEVKLAHTELVWDQLIERYRPLVRLLHPHLKVRTVEICRSYDPAVNVPHSLITSLHSPRYAAGLEVMQWRI